MLLMMCQHWQILIVSRLRAELNSSVPKSLRPRYHHPTCSVTFDWKDSSAHRSAGVTASIHAWQNNEDIHDMIIIGTQIQLTRCSKCACVHQRWLLSCYCSNLQIGVLC